MEMGAMIVDAAVIGGHDRWQRRLDGLARELDRRLEALAADEPDSPRLGGLRRDRVQLDHLRRFAVPVIEELAAWPREASWGEWLDRLERLVPRVLRRPGRVRAVLADLRPIAAVGPVSLRDVREVLAERLASLQAEPPHRRYGRVFVGAPEQVRGLAFDVVCVPGLVERLFPQRPRQDPLLLDAARRRLGEKLPVNEDRRSDERAQLRLAAGAAERRLVLSYPSVEAASGRGRVPSFYMLDVCRAVSGAIPDHGHLGRIADEAGRARLAWPAPDDPARAIDEAEFDLAMLRRALTAAAADPSAARGRARYLIELDRGLARSLRGRWRRWEHRAFTMHDGFCASVGSGDDARALLAPYRLQARAYSPSSLQRYAACPYQFFLAAIHRLQPRESREALLRLDPLTRGSLFHEVQALTLRALMAAGRVPVTAAALDDARGVLDATVDAVADRYRDELAPAIERVWADEIAELRADLRGWLHRLAEEDGTWVPVHVEFGLGFGPDEGRDPSSVAGPVILPGGWRMHGIVDLVERRADGVLRVTDHKTGVNRLRDGAVVEGGAVLQPVLYGLGLEAALHAPVESARLLFCTARGRYSECRVVLHGARGAEHRREGLEVLEIIDRAIAEGFLPAAPREGACDHCEFRSVCGPHELRRMRIKQGRARDGQRETRLDDLATLREKR
jgi:RecB family exonuclease